MTLKLSRSMNITATAPGSLVARNLASWSRNRKRFGSRVSSSWVAAHSSRSALCRCSVMSSMWVIARLLPSPSSITVTQVRAHMTL